MPGRGRVSIFSQVIAVIVKLVILGITAKQVITDHQHFLLKWRIKDVLPEKNNSASSIVIDDLPCQICALFNVYGCLETMKLLHAGDPN